jgi:O-antigen ligase
MLDNTVLDSGARAPYFPLRHVQARKVEMRQRPGKNHGSFAAWMVPVAAMVMLGGGSWTVPIPRFGAEILAVGLLVRTAASLHSRLAPRVLPADCLVIAALGLVIAQLIPLPPGLWGRLPGRGLAMAIDQRVFGFARWRPLSLDPPETWRTVLSMLPGLATYCAVRTGGSLRLRAFVAGFVFAAAISLGLGMMQLLAPDWPEIRPFGLSETRWPVGLFANHNHQGLFLLCALALLPLAAEASPGPQSHLARSGPYVFGVAAFLVGIMVLATGSRASAALLILVLAAVPYARLVPDPGTVADGRGAVLLRLGSRYAVPLVGIAAVIALGGSQALSALNRGLVAEDLRWGFWPDVWHAALAFWPFGSGLGTFVEAFAMHEPLTSLSPHYLNHAHNDYLELMLEAGLPGLAFVFIVLLSLGKAAAKAWFRPAACGLVRSASRAASLSLILIVLGSVVDYPARTFAVSSLVGLCWAIQTVTANAVRNGQCCPRMLGPCACEDAFEAPTPFQDTLLVKAKP